MLTKKPNFGKQSPDSAADGNLPTSRKRLFLLKYGHFPGFQDRIRNHLISPEGEDSHDLCSD